LNQTDAKAWRDIWSAGQGVGQIKRVQTVAEIVADLRREYNEALGNFRRASLEHL
jgi:nitronate monooxygenase